MKLHSEVGEGTTIRLYLPCTDEEEASPRGETLGQGAHRGTETVLLVEDDAGVRKTVAALLVELGYTVIEAHDAQSAFALIEGGVRPDLLFTDIVMPGPMRAVDLARDARERLEGLAVLFTSGHAAGPGSDAGSLDQDVELLSKPYTRDALAIALRKALARRTPAARRTTRRAVAKRPIEAELGGLRVLLVEDEVLIRMATVQMLNSLGCSVVEAVRAEGALAALEAQPFDALMTDINLPGGSGVDLAIQARRQFPELRVVIASGWDLPPDAEEAAELKSVAKLLKPYDTQALEDALRRAG